MRICMKTIMAGPEGIHDAGAVVEIPYAKAQALIAAGYAERTTDEPLPELPPALVEAAAIEHFAETAVMPAAKKRRTVEPLDVVEAKRRGG